MTYADGNLGISTRMWKGLTDQQDHNPLINWISNENTDINKQKNLLRFYSIQKDYTLSQKTNVDINMDNTIAGSLNVDENLSDVIEATKYRSVKEQTVEWFLYDLTNR